MALAVVSGDGLLTSLHAARTVGMVGGRRRRHKGKGKGKGKARTALVLDFDEEEDEGSSSSSSSIKAGKGRRPPALAWFLAPTAVTGTAARRRRRKRMANYFPETIPALASKYDLCAGGAALQAAMAQGGGIGRR